MSSVTTAVHPDKDSVYFQGSLTQMQARQNANINRDNVTFLEIVKNEPRKQSYVDTTEFDAIIGKFPFLSNKFIYKKVIDDARVIPDDMVIKNRMDEYFSPRFYKNILRMYQNAPLYFDYLFSREGINEQRHKQYSVYIYTLCLIEYVMKHYDSNDFKLINGYQLFYDWALPKYSEHISYIIKGPLSKSSSIKIDFKKHYATIMNPANVEGDMTQTLQLASLQNLDTKLDAILRFVMEMPNVYVKVPDHARTYNLIVRSRNVKSYNEPTLNNTFVLDLRGCDFGETTEALQRAATLNTVVTSSIDISSRLSIHKLQELFARYSRFRIVSLNVNNELYRLALDSLNGVDVVFRGVEIASRSVTLASETTESTAVQNTHLSCLGEFEENAQKHIYSFKPFVDINTYDPTKVRVTDARIYLSRNGKPLSAITVSGTLNTRNMYNCEFISNKLPLPNAVAAGFAKTYFYTMNERIEDIEECGVLKLSNALAYLDEGSETNVRAFVNNGTLLFESEPYTGYLAADGSIDLSSSDTPVDLSEWDGSAVSLGNILKTANGNMAYEGSIVIPCSSNNIYHYEGDNGIWTHRDFIYSVFAIDTSEYDRVLNPPDEDNGNDGGVAGQAADGVDTNDVPAGDSGSITDPPIGTQITETFDKIEQSVNLNFVFVRHSSDGSVMINTVCQLCNPPNLVTGTDLQVMVRRGLSGGYDWSLLYALDENVDGVKYINTFFTDCAYDDRISMLVLIGPNEYAFYKMRLGIGTPSPDGGVGTEGTAGQAEVEGETEGVEEKTTVIKIYNGLCFLPPIHHIYDIFSPDSRWKNLKLGVDCRRLKTLYNINRYMPALSVHGIQTTALVVDGVKMLQGYGNNRVELFTDSNVLGSTNITSWHGMTIFSDFTSQILSYDSIINYTLIDVDLFNIQIEFS